MSVNLKKGHEVEVSRLPDCDICKHEDNKPGVPASYDGKTLFGPWANMCQTHFELHGVGTGLGRGQRLIVRGA